MLQKLGIISAKQLAISKQVPPLDRTTVISQWDMVLQQNVTTITPDSNSTNTDTTTDTNNANMADDSSATTNGTSTAKRRRRSPLEIEEFDKDVRLDLFSIGHRQVKILV